MEMFLVAVGFYGIGVLTMLLPHGMQRAAHWLANSVPFLAALSALMRQACSSLVA